MNIDFGYSLDKVETFIPTAAVAKPWLAIGANGNPITVRGSRAAGVAVDVHTSDDVARSAALDVCTEGLAPLICDAQVAVGNRLTVDAQSRGSVADEGVAGEKVSFIVRVANKGADTPALVKIIHT
jgi:hypothetical protein